MGSMKIYVCSYIFFLLLTLMDKIIEPKILSLYRISTVFPGQTAENTSLIFIKYAKFKKQKKILLLVRKVLLLINNDITCVGKHTL